MSDETVDRSTVLHILRANKVEVAEQAHSQDMFLVVKGDISDVIPIPSRCARKLLHNLARRFDIPVFQFWNPTMAPPIPGETVN